MGKFNNGLVKETRQILENEKKQSQLRKKYSIDDNVRVVEKNNFLKFFLNLFINFGRTIATIIICGFAVVGVFSIIYPETNEALKNVFFDLISYF